MTRPPVVRAYLGGEKVADNFAGGGGVSEAFRQAIGRSPDVAINHDAEAIAMHAANHPETRHYLESVWDVDPVAACDRLPVAAAWFSPDCTHHSKAKGGKPRDQKIRGLAWVAVRWAHAVRPRVIFLENVEEFRDWGPLHRSGELAGKPIAARRGETFRAFVRKLERLGYIVEHRLLRACDFGAPTTRKRLFLIARCDGRTIRWPAPTHAPAGHLWRRPYRTAAECIDWTIPCPSIFERDRPLAEATLRRIARGVRRFVLETGSPFIVPGGAAFVTKFQQNSIGHHPDQPLHTVMAGAPRHALAVAYLVHRSNGERVGQAPRIYDVAAPLGTIVAQGQKQALCCAFLAKNYSERPGGGWNGGQALDRGIGTITVRDHHALVAAFLVRYNGTGDAEAVDGPIPTLTAKPRFGLVTVTIAGEEYAVVDIGMRMLTPRELFRAQGFADDYEIAPIVNGKPLTKTAQIRMVGNSVPPPLAAAIVRTNLAEAA